ncbi:hypothetical protein BC826DRAFT_924411, partial [Russula brevipes]
VADVTTLRRHMESNHKAIYQTWVQKNGFISMLPKDAERRRHDAEAEKQPRLDPHLTEMPRKERVIPYTDDLFRAAMIEWLVSTDQPIHALEHPSFHNMVHVAARATSGVKIPSRHQTRRAVIETFKAQLIALRKKLTVWSTISLWHSAHEKLSRAT